MTLHVEFVDALPPQHRQPSAAHIQREFAQALRARPGVWALWPHGIATQSASNIRKGMQAAFRGGVFDAETRNGQLYVRYVGEGGAR